MSFNGNDSVVHKKRDGTKLYQIEKKMLENCLVGMSHGELVMSTKLVGMAKFISTTLCCNKASLEMRHIET